MDDLKRDIATVICPRFPLAIDGLDFGDGGERPLPGGFCVFAVDLPASLHRIAELRRARNSRWPYLCSDLERGAGQQVAGLTRLPPMMALGAANDPQLAFAAGRLTAREAKRAGIDVVFAPVVDVADESANPIVATRAFSADPFEVAALAPHFVRGIQSEGIAATGKHFPGHGATTEDSHLMLPRLSRSRAELARVEEIPFRALIECGTRAMMIGHLHATALDGETRTPTSLSHATIEGYLRRDLGFAGCVVTDALDMGAIAQTGAGTPAENPAVRALLAGADVPLLPADPHLAARMIRDAVTAGILPRARLRDAAERIRTLVSAPSTAAASHGALDLAPDPEGGALALAIARRSITAATRTPALAALAGRDVDVVLIDDGRGATRFMPFLQALEAAGLHPSACAPSAILSRPSVRAAATLIATFSDVRCNKGRIELPAELAALVSKIGSARANAIELSIGCPQALRSLGPSTAGRAVPRLYAYDDDDASLRALAETLAGSNAPSGIPTFLPVGARG